jgi:hypothetical protein
MASIVVDDDVTFTAGAPAKATPFTAFETLPGMLDRLSRKFDKAAEGTVILGPDIVRRLGLPEHAPADLDEANAHPWLTPARERGWSVRRLEPWMTFHHKQRATVHIGIRPWLDAESFELIDPDPAVTAYRMEWITTRMRGTAFRARPGVVGTAAVRRFIPGREPTWQPSNRKRVRPIAMDVAWERPYIWESPAYDVLTESAKYLHGWDVRLQFLAAASLAELPRTPLTNTGVRDFDGTPGYWRIVAPTWNLSHLLPHPVGQHDAEDLVWVTTPRMTLLHELADEGVIPEPVVLDSWTAPHGSRLLRPWAENIRDVIAEAKREPIAADAAVLSKAMKHCYTHAIDMWGGETSSIQRRDWMHTIHGLAGCQLFRKMWKQYKADGRTPVKIYADCLYFPSAHIDPEIDRPSTFDTSPFMGKLRYKQSEELAA